MNKLLTTCGEALDRERPLPEYPRPRFRRDSYLNLNGIWRYAFTRESIRPLAWRGEIVVPFSPESALSGVERRLQADEFPRCERGVTLPEAFASAVCFFTSARSIRSRTYGGTVRPSPVRRADICRFWLT